MENLTNKELLKKRRNNTIAINAINDDDVNALSLYKKYAKESTEIHFEIEKRNLTIPLYCESCGELAVKPVSDLLGESSFCLKCVDKSIVEWITTFGVTNDFIELYEVENKCSLEEAYDYFEKRSTNRYCPRCNNQLMHEQLMHEKEEEAEYPFYCCYCAENMYDFEALDSPRKCN